MPVEPKNAQGRKIIIIAIFGSIGAVWDVLAAAILFHNYSFFESVVVCLLVMILSTVATVRVRILNFGPASSLAKMKEKAIPPRAGGPACSTVSGRT